MMADILGFLEVSHPIDTSTPNSAFRIDDIIAVPPVRASGGVVEDFLARCGGETRFFRYCSSGSNRQPERDGAEIRLASLFLSNSFCYFVQYVVEHT